MLALAVLGVSRTSLGATVWAVGASSLTSLPVSTADGDDPVVRHHPPDAPAQQTHGAADGAGHLYSTTPQVPGAAQPPGVLEHPPFDR